MYDKFNNLTSYAWIWIQTVAVISKTTSLKKLPTDVRYTLTFQKKPQFSKETIIYLIFVKCFIIKTHQHIENKSL